MKTGNVIQAPVAASNDPLLREREVRAVLGSMSRSTFLAKVRAGEIPPPIQLGIKLRAWRSSDIANYIATRPRGLGQRPTHLNPTRGAA